MSCPDTGSYQNAADVLWTSLQNREFIEAFTCTYANAAGGLVVVGTLVWFTVSATSFIRTNGSIAMPVVYTLIFGGAVISQLAAPVIGMVSTLILGAFAIMALLLVRRIEQR